MGIADNPPVDSTPQEQPPTRPRIWTALVVGFGCLPLAVLIGIAGFVTGMLLDGVFGLATDPDRLIEWAAGYMATPMGFVLFLVIPQMTFLACAWVPAVLSPQRFRRRLGFVRGRLPLWSYPVLVVATPAVSFLSYLVLAPFMDEPGGSLEALFTAFREVSGPLAVVLVVFLSVAPAIAEESLFRGYVLRRLLERWHPAAAVGLTAGLFAAAHMDPVHSFLVLPLGVWLGVLVWRDGSIWPAMACHFGTNLYGILGVRYGDPERTMTLHFNRVEWIAISVIVVAFVASVVLLVRIKTSRLITGI